MYPFLPPPFSSSLPPPPSFLFLYYSRPSPLTFAISRQHHQEIHYPIHPLTARPARQATGPLTDEPERREKQFPDFGPHLSFPTPVTRPHARSFASTLSCVVSCSPFAEPWSRLSLTGQALPYTTTQQVSHIPLQSPLPSKVSTVLLAIPLSSHPFGLTEIFALLPPSKRESSLSTTFFWDSRTARYHYLVVRPFVHSFSTVHPAPSPSKRIQTRISRKSRFI